MGKLTIDFQSGFLEDSIIVRVNDKVVFEQENFSTDYSIGLADTLEIFVEEEEAQITVEVESKGISDSIVIKMKPKIFLGISTYEDKIIFEQADEMFPYF